MNEREAIVAWLRNKAQELHSVGDAESAIGERDTALACHRASAVYGHIAATIEAGEPWKEITPEAAENCEKINN